MSQTNLCRLCRNTCTDCIGLCDVNGHFTEVYTITIKFFHPMFLGLEDDTRNQPATLCVDCWHHISGFNNFQQTVLLLQAKLLKDAEQAKLDVQAQMEFSTLKFDSGTVVKAEEVPDEEFVSMSAVELKDTHRKHKLIVTDCDVKFEANPEEDVIPIADSWEEPYDHDDEFDDPVGVFHVGEFNEGDGENLEFQMADDTNDPQMQDGDTIELSTNGISCNADAYSRDRLRKRKRKTLKDLDASIAQWKPNLDCYICQEAFPTFTLLQKHFETKHTNNVCYILCCGRKFKYRCRIEEHVRLHFDPMAFKCTVCNKSFGTKCSLESHMFYLHPSTQQAATSAERRQANYKHRCDICGKAYKVPSALREHYTTHTGQPIHNCPYCDRKFNYRASMCHHLTVAHPEKVNKPSQKNVIRGCSLCPKTFKYRIGLYRHLRNIHPEEFAKRKTRKPKNPQ